MAGMAATNLQRGASSGSDAASMCNTGINMVLYYTIPGNLVITTYLPYWGVGSGEKVQSFWVRVTCVFFFVVRVVGLEALREGDAWRWHHV